MRSGAGRRQTCDALLREPGSAAAPAGGDRARDDQVDPHVYDVVAARTEHRTRSQVALRAAATGALALGACAIGALAVGRLAIGVLSIKRGWVRKLAVEDVEIGRLAVPPFSSSNNSDHFAASSALLARSPSAVTQRP